MKYHQIKHQSELDILTEQTATYENLNFSFSNAYLKELKDLLNDQNPYQLIAKDDKNNFAGYIAALEKHLRPDYLWIAELFVDQKHQKQGIASTLIQKIIQEAKTKKLKGLITQTEFENTPAQNLYEKYGFKKIENPDWKDGITYILNFDNLPLFLRR